MTNSKSNLINRLMVLALIAALASPLAACGRKGSPERPGDIAYPRNYPADLEKEKE